MKIGFVSAILPELSLEEVFKIASEIGYECVEVMCWPAGKASRRYAGVTHIDLQEFGEEEVDQVQSLVTKYGVQISALGYYPNPLSPDLAEAEVASAQIIKMIQAASDLNLSVINSFAGRDPKKTVEENWPRFVDVWKPILDFADKRQIKVGIENCPMLFDQNQWPGGLNLATSPEIWTKMFQEFPTENFGLNFDPSHFVWQGMDYLKAIREYGNRFFHVHAKDVRVDREELAFHGNLAFPSKTHTPKLPGMGDVNWGQFFGALSDAGFQGAVCVEVEDRAFEGSLEDRIRSLKQSYQFLRSYVS